MQVTIAGRPVIVGEIHEPAAGPWTAVCDLDDDGGKVTSGPVTIDVGGALFVGTAEADVQGGRNILRVVAGQDRMRTELPARYYYQPSLGLVLNDLLREAGEALHPDTDQAVLTQRVPRWARLRGEARAALAVVCKYAGASWRVARDGRVLVLRQEAWDQVAMDFVLIGRDPATATVEIAPEVTPLARPGVRVGDFPVQSAVTRWTRGALRQDLTLQTGAAKTADLADAIVTVAKRVTKDALDFSQWYPSRIIAQDADGTVQLLPDDDRIRGNGLTHVPLRHGIPGLTVRVVPGQRALLFFEDGDPMKPCAGLWPDGSSVADVVLKADQRIVHDAPQVVTGAPDAQQPHVLGQELLTWLSAMTVSTAMGPSGVALNLADAPKWLSARHRIDE